MKTIAALIVGACSVLTARGASMEPVARDVYLMGTRATLATHAANRETGLATLESALAVLEQTERELSTWRASSEVSALNRQPIGVPWHANPRLCRMFADVWGWHDATAGAFDPGIGRLLTAWDIHGEGAIPAPEALVHARTASGLGLLAFDPARCTLTKRAEVAIDVGAFGKGEALDRVEDALGNEPWMVDLGGQVSVGGAVPPGGWSVAIAHPRRRDQPYLQVRMVEGSLSTSAGSERDLVVNGVRVGHIFDPRTGHPASFTGSVTVWHRRGLAADALSTALYVMGPEDGMAWADARGIAAVYLIPDGEHVRVAATRAFSHTPGFDSKFSGPE